MKSRLFLSALVVAMLIASDASARGRGGGGYGGGAGSTPFGSAMLGIGAATAAAGRFNLSTSQAATTYQQAYQSWIGNQRLREQTYFDMRRTSASYRAEQEMQHPHATPDRVDEFNHLRLPAQLSPSEFDPVNGVIQWPTVLNRKEFDASRARLEALFAEAAANPQSAGLGTESYRDIQGAISEMDGILHSKISLYKPEEYMPASKFLKSLAFAARTPGSDAPAKK
jgi:hypothetical protein